MANFRPAPVNRLPFSGTPKEVAQQIALLHYDKVQAIIFPAATNGHSKAPVGPTEDIFAEMAAYTANAPHADDSREAIYTRKPGE